MNELVDMIVKKTGVSQQIAQQAANIVIDYLKKRLPSPIAGQIDSAMQGGGAMKGAEDMLNKFGGGNK